MAKRSKSSGRSKKARPAAKSAAEAKQKPEGRAESAAPSASGLKRKHFLIITICVIVGVELLIVSGLWQRYTISRHRKLAEANMSQQKYEKALEHWQVLLEIAPFSASVNRGAGMTYYSLGQYDKAIQALQIVLDEVNDLEGMNAQIGLSFVQKGEIEKALPYFEQELRIDPTNPDANYYLGKYYYEQGDLKSAAARFQAVGRHWKYRDEVKQYIQEINEQILEGMKERDEVEGDEEGVAEEQEKQEGNKE